ncbi:hypothetical protein KSP39_PZI016603 [Platanthera zijinensis]|uniref:Transmembrane protein n=1 Tax=Platanthera zijinensis TaxID=2320716 RepID=A0AAP0B858_9ASPA
MSLLSRSSAITFLCPSSSQSSPSPSSPHRLLSYRTTNGAPIDCCIAVGRISMSANGNRGFLPLLPFSSLALDASSTDNLHFRSTSIGSPPPSLSFSRWNLGPRHILLLNIIACTVAVSSAWLFFSAIPTLLAFKRAAESLEKSLDAMTEEVPDTMAAMRLSGMEISDLTMELSDLGQEITRGVRSSTRAVRVAEERLRRLTTMNPIVSTQVLNSQKEMEKPHLAKNARTLREGIVKGRALFGAIFGASQFSRWAWNYFMSRGRRR